MVAVQNGGSVMLQKIIMSIKRWWWERKGYLPVGLALKRDWKVGMEGSMHEDIGPFIVKGVDLDKGFIWVTFKRRHND